MSNGKGDTQRPQQVSDAEMARNWARVFGSPFCGRCGYMTVRGVCTKCMWRIGG